MALGAVLLASCGANRPAQTTPSTPTRDQSEDHTPGAVASEGALVNPRMEDFGPVAVPRMLPLDGIRPVYQPQFRRAGEAPLQDDELVIGVALADQAKAYPISVLRFREMVNDDLAGNPILVTW